MPLISHRGAAGLAPENSYESIVKAGHFDPVYIEVDIHLTSDEIFVIHHGEAKRAYSGRKLPMTAEQLKKHVPLLITLKELIKKPLPAALLLDIKTTENTAELITILKKAPLQFRSAFTSPHDEVLYALKTAFPKAKTFIAQPYHHGPIQAIEIARDFNFSGISLNKWWLGPLVTLLCRHYKKEIMVYTVNHTLWIRLIRFFFPRVYICTNYPNKYAQ